MTKIINGVASEFEFPADTGVFTQNVFEKENQELKEQLQENTETLLGRILELRGQQKEFIKWLENGIEKVKNTEFLDERIQRAGLIAYNRCLQKYKSIIGDDK